MTDNFQVKGQYRASAESVRDYTESLRGDGVRDAGMGAACIALSNLAVAEAVHLLRQSIEGDMQAVVEALSKERPVVVNSTGTVELDPAAVAESVQQILDGRRRET